MTEDPFLHERDAVYDSAALKFLQPTALHRVLYFYSCDEGVD